jgi:Transglutaminase-like superfamily
MMRRVLLSLWCCSMSSLACQPGPTELEAPDARVLAATAAAAFDNHRELEARMLGRKLGEIVVDRERLENGGERWHTTVSFTLALDDPGESAKHTQTVEIVEYGPDRAFVRGSERTQEGEVEESTEIERRGNELVVRVKGPAHDREQRFAIPAGFDSDIAVFERLRDQVDAGAALPHAASYSSFDEDELRFEQTQVTLVARTKAKLGGVEIDAWELEEIDDEGERTRAVLDDSGMPIRIEVGVFTAAVAGSEPATAASADVKLSSYLEVEGKIDARADELRVAIAVAGDDANDRPIFRDNAYQSVLRSSAGSYQLTLHAVRGTGLPARTLPLADLPAEVASALAPTPTSQSDDRDIVAHARQIVGKRTDAREAAVAIVGWVHRNLGKKDGTRGAATAVETLTAGFGDCTEHAALTVALLRAAGLPARNAGGIVLVPGFFGSDAGYHAWVEVWLGEWVVMDPALGPTRVGPHYILLGHEEPGMSSGGAEMARLIGRTKIRVVD